MAVLDTFAATGAYAMGVIVGGMAMGRDWTGWSNTGYIVTTAARPAGANLLADHAFLKAGFRV